MRVFVFCVGSCIGSFLQLAAIRLPSGKSIVSPSSHCDSCGKKLRKIDMMPVISYLFLRGRCRECNARIPIQTILSEILFGIITMLLYWKYGFSMLFFVQMALVGILFIMALIDAESKEIYDLHLWMLAALVIPARFIENASVWNALPGIIIWLLISFLLKDKMGEGDKFLIAILLFSFEPVQQIHFFLYSIWSAAILAVFLLIRGKSGKTPIPFVPFITIGYLSVLLDLRLL